MSTSMASRLPLPVVTGPTHVPTSGGLPESAYPQGNRIRSMRLPMALSPKATAHTSAMANSHEPHPDFRLMSRSRVRQRAPPVEDVAQKVAYGRALRYRTDASR